MDYGDLEYCVQDLYKMNLISIWKKTDIRDRYIDIDLDLSHTAPVFKSTMISNGSFKISSPQTFLRERHEQKHHSQRRVPEVSVKLRDKIWQTDRSYPTLIMKFSPLSLRGTRDRVISPQNFRSPQFSFLLINNFVLEQMCYSLVQW
ncbi:unnamed protein product [Meloidogyne enterolobii]|uniref:Uncharacterized protein n=1 Tax=Meloidogyne enterolobii TaxID=390850 RepID=A0ACB0ZU48_MELEN